VPEITGAAWTGSWAPCCLCGEPTDSWGDAPGLPDVGRIPIHVFCAGAVIVAYRRLASRRAIWGDDQAMLPSIDRVVRPFETGVRHYLAAKAEG
jgi:hypothetical protein